MSDRHVLHEAGGTITISAAALDEVVQQAAEAVDGARLRKRRRGLEVRVADGRAYVELDLSARYGAVLPELARSVQEEVAGALGRMCGLEIEAVDVAIEELEGP